MCNKNGWYYIGKGFAVAVVGAGVCAVAIYLSCPAVLWGLLAVAIISANF